MVKTYRTCNCSKTKTFTNKNQAKLIKNMTKIPENSTFKKYLHLKGNIKIIKQSA